VSDMPIEEAVRLVDTSGLCDEERDPEWERLFDLTLRSLRLSIERRRRPIVEPP
jgi:hypothetical protein